MHLSDCCGAGPKTLVNDQTFGFCSQCLNWSPFAMLDQDEEGLPLDEYVVLFAELIESGKLVIFDPNTKNLEKPEAVSINGTAVQITQRNKEQ